LICHAAIKGLALIPAEEIAVFGDPFWQRFCDGVGHINFLIRRNNGTGHKGRRQGLTYKGCDLGVQVFVPGANIGMHKGNFAFETLCGHWQGFENIAKEKVVIIGNAFRVGGNLPVEHKDFPVRHDFAQMIERATIAKANLQHDPVLILDHFSRSIQAIALGLQAADNTV
tara:strand:- start:4455 stop:4964 length:510 start_codon:yes stop_codon:yes gene_type:complete